MPFKPGQSGNLKGRPRKGHTITEELEKYAKYRKADPQDGKKRSQRVLLAKKMWDMALDGDVVSIKYICDRLDGKPTERFEGEVSLNMNIKDITKEIREFLVQNYPEVHEELLTHLTEKYNDRDR